MHFLKKVHSVDINGRAYEDTDLWLHVSAVPPPFVRPPTSLLAAYPGDPEAQAAVLALRGVADKWFLVAIGCGARPKPTSHDDFMAPPPLPPGFTRVTQAVAVNSDVVAKQNATRVLAPPP